MKMGCCGSKGTRKTTFDQNYGKDRARQVGNEKIQTTSFDTIPKNGFVPNTLQPKKEARIYVALYDYAARTHKDLGFRKGETFEILDLRDPAWWLARASVGGREGYVPSNYVAKQKSLDIEEWYVGGISRKEADRRLMAPGIRVGTFLVRDSQTHAGSYSLSMQDIDEDHGGQHVKHFRIQWRVKDDIYFIIDSCQFRNVTDLVDHYRHHADGLNTHLTVACPKINPETIGLGKDAWEIDRNSLKFDCLLGNGQFGEVWKGTWNGVTPVAVKTMKADTMAPSFFLAEANIMKKMKHKHLVQLYAVCSDREPIYIVTELMSRGSLLEVLRSNEGRAFTLHKLIDISAQIASGMSFLEDSNYVHRDLAARNVLVNENYLCKVADFGLARVIDEFYQHRPNPNKQLKFPIKWTAPEAAFYGRFTIKSDVWSYGILLAEIVTYGAIPYGKKTGNQVLNEIEKGGRMEKMPGCPDPLYNVMLDCWKKSAQDRPTFEFLHSYMDDYFVTAESAYRDPRQAGY